MRLLSLKASGCIAERGGVGKYAFRENEGASLPCLHTHTHPRWAKFRRRIDIFEAVPKAPACAWCFYCSISSPDEHARS